LQSGATHVTDDAMALIAHPATEIVIEATGDPIAAAHHLAAAFAHGKHAISATVEADAICGAALAAMAEKAGVIYSMAYGDQPAMTVDLVDWARTCGFEVVAAGRGHKWKPEYRFSTPDTVWDHWGLTAEQAAQGRLNPKMFNSFLDGTKPVIETAAIANACGLDAPSGGLGYPAGSIDDLPNQMRPAADGGVLDRAGMVEVQNCLDRHGNEIGYDIRMGVWVCLRAVTDYQARCFLEYKVTTDDTGRYFAAYKRWHLIGLELGVSVASVALRGEATGTAAEFRADVVALAKRDLAAGEILDGEGGHTVAGQLRPARASIAMHTLPLGLSGGAKMIRPVAADTIVTHEDVRIDQTTTAFRLRANAEALLH
ncbi:MAG: flagellar biosynthesis protein FlgA, partial [Rhodobacteraceae bacterium]|nr:flagellar biosynthesis protein FlgA [Paracoccaceae bacterium]